MGAYRDEIYADVIVVPFGSKSMSVAHQYIFSAYYIL